MSSRSNRRDGCVEDGIQEVIMCLDLVWITGVPTERGRSAWEMQTDVSILDYFEKIEFGAKRQRYVNRWEMNTLQSRAIRMSIGNDTRVAHPYSPSTRGMIQNNRGVHARLILYRTSGCSRWTNQCPCRS